MQEHVSQAMRDLLLEIEADGICLQAHEQSALHALDRYLSKRANEFVEMAAQKLAAE